MEKRFLDTSKAIALGPDGVSNLNYEPVITYYVQQEMVRYGVDTSSTHIVFVPSWKDFGDPIISGEWGSYYQWIDSENKTRLQIWHHNRPFGLKAPCGCNATVQIYDGKHFFYCCESVASKDADFSIFIGIILYPEFGPPDTQDKHLGQTCNIILKNLQNNKYVISN